MLKKALFSILFLLVIQVNAQRNNFKLLGYALNQSFSNGMYYENGINSSINLLHHSFTMGFERTLGNRLSVGINYHFLSKLTAEGISIYASPGNYEFNANLKASGWTYESRYYFDDFENGAPDANYLCASYGQFNYINHLTVIDAGSGLANPLYLGNLAHAITIKKISLRYGHESVKGNFLFDYYVGVDLNIWNDTYDKPNHLVTFTSTQSRNSFNFNLGIIMGFGI